MKNTTEFKLRRGGEKKKSSKQKEKTKTRDKKEIWEQKREKDNRDSMGQSKKR